MIITKLTHIVSCPVTIVDKCADFRFFCYILFIVSGLFVYVRAVFLSVPHISRPLSPAHVRAIMLIHKLSNNYCQYFRVYIFV